MTKLNFEYDPRKAATNLRKHGVSFDEAATVFADPLRSILRDDEHSLDEQRFITVGYSTRDRILFVVYTDRLQRAPHWRPRRHRDRAKTI